MSTLFIFTTCMFISLVASASSDCRARYENWFDSSKAIGSFGFTLQNNSDSLLLYSYGNILYSPPPFDYYTNADSFVTYSDSGSASAGTPTFTATESSFMFFDARSLVIHRSGLISISSIGKMGSSVEFEISCDGDVFTGKSSDDGNLYVMQFHSSIPASSPSSADTSSSSSPSPITGTVHSVTTSPSECKATVVSKARKGATWTEGEESYEVFDFIISNSGNTRITSLSVDLKFSKGAVASSTWNLFETSDSSSSYSISVDDFFTPKTVLSNFAGLVAKDGSVLVESVYAVCA